MSSIETFRSVFAKLLVARAEVSDEALVRAFSVVPREGFLGAGPWTVFTPMTCISTETDDPRILYQDILIALSVERGINNGQPSLHARSLALLRPAPGETVVHVGCGTGYYSAILAELVGPSGAVHAYEIEQDLAELATNNLRGWSNVTVSSASGIDARLPGADVIYVNAGATRPMDSWLDALALGGRLMLPFTADDGAGQMLLVTRDTQQSYGAKLLYPVRFIPCTGARDEAGSQALSAALEGPRKTTEVQSLVRNVAPDESAWCIGTNWWLSVAAPA